MRSRHDQTAPGPLTSEGATRPRQGQINGVAVAMCVLLALMFFTLHPHSVGAGARGEVALTPSMNARLAATTTSLQPLDDHLPFVPLTLGQAMAAPDSDVQAQRKPVAAVLRRATVSDYGTYAAPGTTDSGRFVLAINGEPVWALVFSSKIGYGSLFRTHMRGEPVRDPAHSPAAPPADELAYDKTAPNYFLVLLDAETGAFLYGTSF